MKMDLRPGETVTIGDVTVTLVKKSGQVASLLIVADKAVPITPPRSPDRATVHLQA